MTNLQQLKLHQKTDLRNKGYVCKLNLYELVYFIIDDNGSYSLLDDQYVSHLHAVAYANIQGKEGEGKLCAEHSF